MAEDSTQPPDATSYIETTRGILSYSQLAPLLAERVLGLLEDIEDGEYASRRLDESVLLDFHSALCADLIQDWAGRFRTGEVKVGQHVPPPSHQVLMLLHDYFGDLNTRLIAAEEQILPETLAYAEGRLLSIHPFMDLNGRVTRLFLAEILRRKDLPPVELAPSEKHARDIYIQALRAADELNWSPLAKLWEKRLESTQ